MFLFDLINPFKNKEKFMLFHARSSVLLLDTYTIVLTFYYVQNQLDKKKAMVNFKIYDVTTNNCNTHIAKYFKR